MSVTITFEMVGRADGSGINVGVDTGSGVNVGVNTGSGVNVGVDTGSGVNVGVPEGSTFTTTVSCVVSSPSDTDTVYVVSPATLVLRRYSATRWVPASDCLRRYASELGETEIDNESPSASFPTKETKPLSPT